MSIAADKEWFVTLRHYGDPCVHCDTPHDEVAVGPCPGDASKAVPMAYRSLGVRWDHVEHFLIQMSSGEFVDRHEHVEMNLPYTYLSKARYVPDLRRSAPAHGDNP